MNLHAPLNYKIDQNIFLGYNKFRFQISMKKIHASEQVTSFIPVVMSYLSDFVPQSKGPVPAQMSHTLSFSGMHRKKDIYCRNRTNYK